MADFNKIHEILSDLKRVADELNAIPTREAYRQFGKFSTFEISKIYPTFGEALKAAGIGPEKFGDVAKEKAKPFKFKFQKNQIDSFSLVEIELADLFKRLGNPKTIKTAFMPDTHVENRDVRAVKAFVDFLRWYQPDLFCIMGDFLDAEGISHWPSDKLKPRDFIREVTEARELLAEIQDATPNCQHRVFITGNHEDWIRQAMVQKMPEFFFRLDELGLTPDLEKLLDLDKFGYDVIPLNAILKIGKAHFTHGLYTGGNHPKKHLDTIKGNIYYGHLHDVFETHQPSINGFIEAASFGCLCKLNAPFMKGKPTNWAHGFGLIEFFPDGSYSRYTPKIFNGRFSYNGMIFGE